MENKNEKLISIGYPFYSQNKIVKNNLKLKDSKNLKLLTTVFTIMIIITLSSYFFLPYQNAFAIGLNQKSLRSINNNYGSVSATVTGSPTITDPRFTRFFLVYTALGYFGSKFLGGLLLLPPSESMGTGYGIGTVMSYIIVILPKALKK